MLSLDCPGLGFISGLFISPLLFRTENKGDFFTDLATQFSSRDGQYIDQVGGDHSELEAGTQAEIVSHSKELLTEKVKVLCWIMTGPKTHQNKVREGLISLSYFLD